MEVSKELGRINFAMTILIPRLAEVQVFPAANIARAIFQTVAIRRLLLIVPNFPLRIMQQVIFAPTSPIIRNVDYIALAILTNVLEIPV